MTDNIGGGPRMPSSYETLASIEKSLERAIMGIERLDEKLEDSTSSSRATLSDHEARLRILEASLTAALATQKGTSGALDWVWSAIWPVAAIIMSVLSYLK